MQGRQVVHAVPPPAKAALFLVTLAACRSDVVWKDSGPHDSESGTVDSDCPDVYWSTEEGEGPTAPPSTGGTVRLNLKVDHFGEGPAGGSQAVSFLVSQVDFTMQRKVNGQFLPPEQITVATGPAPITIWSPESEVPLFAGDWELPPGRVLDVRVGVQDMAILDDQGSSRAVVFGLQRNSSGVLRFQPAPGLPAPVLDDGGRLGWQMVIPAGASGALHEDQDGRFRLDPMLPGGPMPKPRPFGFSEEKLLVHYVESATEQQIDAFEEQNGAQTVWTSPTGLRAVAFEGADWWSISSRFLAWRVSPLVESVALDPLMRTTGLDTGAADDYKFAEDQAWLWDARVAPADDDSTVAAWDDVTGDRSVVVGFIDTGLDVNHPDIVNNLYVNVDELPENLVLLCDLDPDELGLSAEQALDFDEDGVFTLHDLNAELVDDSLRVETLAALDDCGYALTATASSSAFDIPTMYDPAFPIFQGEDLLAVFADGLDTDENGYVDDIFGVNFRAVDSRCVDGTWDAATCAEWDVNPTDDMADAYAPYFSSDAQTPGIQHGTQMAGILGAEGNNERNVSGVMQEARIIEARAAYVHDWDPDPINWTASALSFDIVLAAMDYLMSEGAHIIVLEFGSAVDILPDCDAEYRLMLQEEFEARSAAVFILAAANEGRDCDDQAVFCFPAEVDAANVVSVGGTNLDASTGEMISWWSGSNFGDETLDLAAPAVDVATIQPGFPDDGPIGYAQYALDIDGATDGTSAAIAVVAGAAALRVAACGDPVDGSVLAEELITNSQDRSADLVCGGDPCVAGGAFVDAGAVVAACMAAP